MTLIMKGGKTSINFNDSCKEVERSLRKILAKEIEAKFTNYLLPFPKYVTRASPTMNLHDLFEEAISIKQLHFHRSRHRERQKVVSHKGETIAKIVTPD